LNEHFVGPHHAQVVSGTLFNRLLPLDKITHLALELLITLTQRCVDRLLLLNLVFEFSHFEHAATSPPQRVLHREEQTE
jgi:hypothetical protein